MGHLFGDIECLRPICKFPLRAELFPENGIVRFFDALWYIQATCALDRSCIQEMILSRSVSHVGDLPRLTLGLMCHPER